MKKQFIRNPAFKVLLRNLLYGVIIFIVASCNKSDDNGPDGFSFTFADSSFTATEAHASVGYLLITATIGQDIFSGKRVEIILNSLNKGTYPVTNIAGTPNPNFIRYKNDLGIVYGSASGSVTITSANNDKLTGNFSAIMTLYSGEAIPFSGNFKNVPIRP